MRRNRALWASIIFVLVLVLASLVGVVAGGLRPTLGLDLQGGASVILTAPEGTPPDVMQRALENIRNRVDAFGVGEPDIALSGTTIEVQIPGAAEATVQRREADLSCLEGADLIHGCSKNEDDVREVLESLKVQAEPSEVCVVDGNGVQVECFSSRTQAETYLSWHPGRTQGGGFAQRFDQSFGVTELFRLAVRRTLAGCERVLLDGTDG